MIVFPAIDLFGGRVVKFDAQTHSAPARDYGAPEEIARQWLDAGATHLHVVDLDGAMATGGTNAEPLAAIQRLAVGRGAQVYFGGGLREARAVGESLNGLGVSRAILGTRAITDPSWLSLMVKLFRDRLIVAIDAAEGRIVVKGWQQATDIAVLDFVKRASEWPVGGFLFTNVSVEGREQGVDWKPVEEIVKATARPVIFSGGVTSLQEVVRFRDLGAFGVVIGSALYAGTIRLREAIAAAGGA